jgi:hypothetical protein
MLLLPLPLLALFVVGSQAEHIYEEIQWSSELCAQMGHADGEFDVCGQLEFCEGDEDDFQYIRRRRSLRRRKHRGEHNDDSMSKTDAKSPPKIVEIVLLSIMKMKKSSGTPPAATEKLLRHK